METFSCNRCKGILKSYCENSDTMSYLWLCPQCDKAKNDREINTNQNNIDSTVDEIISLLNESESKDQVLSQLKNYIISI